MRLRMEWGEVVTPITPTTVAYAALVAVRNAAIAKSFLEIYPDVLLRRGGRDLVVLAAALRAFYEQFGSAPDRAQLAVFIENEREVGSVEMADRDWDNLHALVDGAFDSPDLTSHNSRRLAGIAIRSLRTQGVSERTRNRIDSGAADELPEILRSALRDVAAAASGSTSPAADLFPPNWETRSAGTQQNWNSPVLDCSIGPVNHREIVVHLAPYGCGKTNFSVDLAASNSSFLSAAGDPDQVVLYVSTEPTVEELRERLLANLALIPRSRVIRVTRTPGSSVRFSNQSTPGAGSQLQIGSPDYYDTAYETHLFGADSENVFRSERQRIEEAISLVRQRLVLVPFMPVEGAPERGFGGVAEMIPLIDIALDGRRPYLIIVDHMSALAQRLADKMKGEAQSAFTAAVKRTVLDLRDNLTSRYAAPMWVAHQIKGALTKAKPTQIFHHSEAAGSSQIGEFADMVLCTGTLQEEVDRTANRKYGLGRFHVSKKRRNDSNTYSLGVFELDGDFQRIFNRTMVYRVHEERGRILPNAQTSYSPAFSSDGAIGFDEEGDF